MFKIIFIVMLLANFAFRIYLQVLENKQVGKPLPKSVADIYNKEEYERYISYTNEKKKLSLASGLAGLVFFVIMYATNIFSFLFNAMPGNELGKILLVDIVINLVSTIIDVPFDYVATFKIEEKFGFNKSTKKTFVLDIIKNAILGIVLNSCILLPLVYFAYKWIGPYFAIVAFVAIAAVVVIMSMLSTVFSKIFNKFTSLPEGELRTNLKAMFEEAGFKLKDIYVMDASRRTTKANAYCGGIGKLKQIVLYDNLVNNYSDGEITAVFAHELAHFKNKDTTKMTFFNLITFVPMLLMMTACMLVPEIYMEYGFEEPSILLAYYVSFGQVLGLVNSLIHVPFNYMSRAMERRADALAYEKGYGDELISGLKKLSKDSLSDMNPHPTIVKLLYNHPPLHERIELIEAKKNNQ